MSIFTESIILHNGSPDGGMAVVHPVREERGGVLQGEEEVLAKAQAKLPPYATDIEIVPREDVLNKDRTFRNAWVKANGLIRTDLPKAKDIWREKIRRKRDLLFKDLDEQYLRADENSNGVAKKEVADQKQILRDMPSDPAIETATTPDEIKAFWPIILGDRD